MLRASAVVVVVLASWSCVTKMGEPTLAISVSPNRITNANPVTVKVSAISAEGNIGTGSVRITSVRGSLTAGVDVPLDSFGTARTELVCDPMMDLGCFNPVRVVAEWTVDGSPVIAQTTLNASSTTGSGGGAGGGGGAVEDADAGYTVLVTECSRTVNPGAKPSCCYSANSPDTKAPTCGWVRVNPGASFPISMTLVDGGSPNTELIITNPLPVGDLTDASQCDLNWTFRVETPLFAGSGAFFSCYRFAVFPDDSWQLATNTDDGCGLKTSFSSMGDSFLGRDCQDMFARRDNPGSVRLITGAKVRTAEGQWVQSDNTVYVVPIRRVIP